MQACRRHRTSPTASAALGRALLGSLLLGCFRAEGEATQVRLSSVSSLLSTPHLSPCPHALYAINEVCSACAESCRVRR